MCVSSWAIIGSMAFFIIDAYVAEKKGIQNNMTDLVQMMEQFGVMVENQASVIAGYYRKLMAEGLPEGLASALTIQFAALWWARSMANDNGE